MWTDRFINFPTGRISRAHEESLILLIISVRVSIDGDEVNSFFSHCRKGIIVPLLSI